MPRGTAGSSSCSFCLAKVCGLFAAPTHFCPPIPSTALPPLLVAAPGRGAERNTGASPQAVDHDGYTVLHWAAWSGKLASARLLLEWGVAIDPLDRYGYTPLYR